MECVCVRVCERERRVYVLCAVNHFGSVCRPQTGSNLMHVLPLEQPTVAHTRAMHLLPKNTRDVGSMRWDGCVLVLPLLFEECVACHARSSETSKKTGSKFQITHVRIIDRTQVSMVGVVHYV